MSMKEMLKIAQERRDRAAAFSREYRQKHRDRPEPKVVDRVMLEALIIVLADREIVDARTAKAIGDRVAELSRLGLGRLGYADEPLRRALAVRLVEHAGHSKGTAIKPALMDIAVSGRVRPVRDRSVAAA